jgi:hypothetical protein
VRRRWAGALLVLLSACNDTTELRAWRVRRDVAELELKRLRALRVDPTADAQFDALAAELRALNAELDVIATARDADAGVRGTADRQGITLTVVGSLEDCLAALRALEPHRALTLAWTLRIENGRCVWLGGESPALAAHRAQLATPTTSRPEPPPSRLSYGVKAVREEVERLEAAQRAERAALGRLSGLDELATQVNQARAVRSVLEAAPRPCDLRIVERAVALHDGTLLEVAWDALVHPLEPLNDRRLAGLVVSTAGGPRWTCSN